MLVCWARLLSELARKGHVGSIPMPSAYFFVGRKIEKRNKKIKKEDLKDWIKKGWTKGRKSEYFGR